ncbi:hypothetical protein KI387_024057, partial [Taxus chinensis]
DKFLDIVTPATDKTKEDITASYYQITRVALGRVITEGAQQDVWDATNMLCQKLKEMKDSRYEQKGKVEQLTE